MSRDVTGSNVLQNCHVSTFVYDDSAISIAKSCIPGHFEEYYFFQYDDDEYVLIVSDDCQIINSTHFSAFESTVYVFYKSSVPVNDTHSISIGGTITEVGAPPRVDDVSLSGYVNDTQYNTIWELSSFNVESAHIYNTQYMAYGSMGNLPRLVEGVDYYAYAAFFLAGLVICFKLADRIFRRVY